MRTIERGDVILKLGTIRRTFVYLYLDELTEALVYWHRHEWAYQDWAEL